MSAKVRIKDDALASVKSPQEANTHLVPKSPRAAALQDLVVHQHGRPILKSGPSHIEIFSPK